jgi:MoxR-like ATPase
VAPAAFDAERIEVLVFELVNERRAEEGLDPLEMNRSLASEVREMARNHSETMAEADAPRHTINGVSSTDRYEENELYYTCRWETDNEGLMRADVNSFESNQSAFEAVTRTIAGREYATPDDVRDIARPVLAHRLVLTAEAQVNDVDKREIIDDVLDGVPVPTVE